VLNNREKKPVKADNSSQASFECKTLIVDSCSLVFLVIMQSAEQVFPDKITHTQFSHLNLHFHSVT